MKFHQSLFLFAILISTSFCETSNTTESPLTPPNIIFIMADDHANRTISAYGSGINNTPNIDRIASEGALFLNSFCANSICGPSRAAILTGKHAHKNGVIGNGMPWDSTQMVFPRILQRNGYQTALFGKWHLNSKPADEFDTYKILTGAGKQGFYYNPEYYSSNGETEDVPGYSTDLTTEYALNWLDSKRDKDKPFCLLVQYKAPHVPRMPPLKNIKKYLNDTIPEPETLHDDLSTRSYYAKQVNFFLNNYRPIPPFEEHDPGTSIYFKRMKDEEFRAYHEAVDPQNAEYQRLVDEGLLEDSAAMRSYTYQRFIKDYLRIVDVLDENIGRILDRIDRDPQLSKNTIIVYTSDQSYFTGEHGYAEKRLMYEEAMRMPLMIRWPGHITQGQKVPQLVQNIDYAPTLLDAAGIPVPEEMQGQSILPLFEGNNPEWRKALYYHYYDHGRHRVGRHHGIRTERYKLIHFYTDDVWEFYDLKNDPVEVNNLYGDPGHASLIDSLKQELNILVSGYDVPEEHFTAPYPVN